MPITEPFARCERGNQRLGSDQVTDAKRGKDRPREGPDVDDASFGLQALQGLQRVSFVTELAIIVVLNYHRVLAPIPFEERLTPGERKNRAGWKLVRWRYEGYPSILRQLGWSQAVAINWHRQQAAPRGSKYLPRSLIARILDGDTIAAIYPHPRNQIQRLLRPVHNDHLRRITNHGARPLQVGRDSVAQGNVPRCRAIVKLAHRSFARMPQ